MTRLLLLAASLLLGISGCVGGTDAGEDDDPGDGDGMTLSLVCEATLTVSGSLEPAGATPGPDDGCVPEGTWRLTVAVDDPGDCDTVNVNGQYVYDISRDANEELVMTYLGNDGNDELDNLKPAAAGGTCRANIEHYSSDSLEAIYLKPFEDDLLITGSGTYELWE